MSDGATDPIRILHVDDDRDMGEMVAIHLERQNDDFEVVTETSADAGLERLADSEVDCVVSDHDMPVKDGLAFLREVRETDHQLPFILFTGKGSEEIASEAISAGVTEYLQKETGTDQYAVLANRIERAVSANRAKEALEESQRRLSTLISNLPGMVYRCTNEPGWPMTFVSDGSRDLAGYEPEAIESGEVSWGTDVIVEADRRKTWRKVQRAVEAGEPFEVTYRIETADGERRWMWERGCVVDADGEADVIEGFVTDITARKERERELRAERDFTESLINSLDDVFYVVSDDGAFLRWNDRFSEVTGYSSEEIESMDVFDFFPADYHETIVDSTARAIRSDDVAEFEAEIATKAGDRIPLECRGTPVYDPDGELVGICGVGRDVSNRSHRERELESFASVVSHDLRNPLNVVQGRVQIALENGNVDDLEPALAAAERMERLISDAVRLARAGRDRDAVEPVAIADAARDAWNDVVTGNTDALAASESSLDVETARTVDADPARLRELFSHLFENAIRHGGDGDAPVAVRVGDLDGGFFVEDDGVGIDGDRRSEVFERGYTTSRDGTGFGLPIVEGIAAAHGWRVSITDGAGGDDVAPGTRFEIRV